MSACNIVRDLMPLYHDSAISAQSRKYIREHLLTCPDCRRFYRELRADRRHSAPLSAAPSFSPDTGYASIVSRMREQERIRARNRTILSGLNLALSIGLLATILTKTHKS